MSRIDALVNIDRKAWHACGDELARALFAWRDYAEFAWGTPTPECCDAAMVAVGMLLQTSMPQEEEDVLMTWKMMLEAKRAA